MNEPADSSPDTQEAGSGAAGPGDATTDPRERHPGAMGDPDARDPGAMDDPDARHPGATRTHLGELGGLSWLRLCFVDIFGTLRSVQIPSSRFEDALQRGVIFDGSALEGRIRLLEADRVLRPDLRTLAPLDETTARVLCSVTKEDGEPWLLDPRSALQEICRSHEDVALAWRGAVEIEWYLVDESLDPIDRGGYFSDLEGKGRAIAMEAAESLERLGIRVAGIHHEGGPGQYEIDLMALPPMEVADAITYAKALVADSAICHGARATFVARPLAGQPGSGMHIHQHLSRISRWVSGPLSESDGKAVAGPDADNVAGGGASGGRHPGELLGSEGDAEVVSRWMIGGILRHARGLSALAAPSVSSYRRLHSGPEAPGAAVWAHMNRAALVRMTNTELGTPSVEYRGADPSANPYLLIGGLLVAIDDGLSERASPGRPLEEEPAGFDPAAVESAPRDLPRSLDAATQALLEDEVLVDAFDGRLIGRLVDGQRAEADAAGANVTRADLLSSLDS